MKPVAKGGLSTAYPINNFCVQYQKHIKNQSIEKSGSRVNPCGIPELCGTPENIFSQWVYFSSLFTVWWIILN